MHLSRKLILRKPDALGGRKVELRIVDSKAAVELTFDEARALATWLLRETEDK